MCYHAEERETSSVTVTDLQTSQAAVTVASQTDRDTNNSLIWMIHQFLTHMIDLKRGNLINKLVTEVVLTSDERERIKKLKKNDAKVNSLMAILKEKSAAEFDSFLTTLSETGQQSVADVVRQALFTAGQSGQNPLHPLGYSTAVLSLSICLLLLFVEINFEIVGLITYIRDELIV